jgi:hypothetical protein
LCIQISENDVLFLHDFLFIFHALTTLMGLGQSHGQQENT